jgi:hypothetical protein
MLEQAIQQSNVLVVFFKQFMAEMMAKGQYPEGTNGVSKQRMGSIEGIDETTLRGLSPSSRLNRCRAAKSEFVKT